MLLYWPCERRLSQVPGQPSSLQGTRVGGSVPYGTAMALLHAGVDARQTCRELEFGAGDLRVLLLRRATGELCRDMG